MLLAQMRWTGASVELGEGGAIEIEPVELVPAELLQQAKQQKPDLLAALRKEAFAGVALGHSRLGYVLDQMWESAWRIRKAGCEAEACTRFMAMISHIQECQTLEEAKALIAKHSKLCIETFERIVLATQGGLVSGADLEALARNIFGAPSPERSGSSDSTWQSPPPQPARPAPALDASAFFAEPAAPEPKQISLGGL